MNTSPATESPCLGERYENRACPPESVIVASRCIFFPSSAVILHEILTDFSVIYTGLRYLISSFVVTASECVLAKKTDAFGKWIFDFCNHNSQDNSIFLSSSI